MVERKIKRRPTRNDKTRDPRAIAKFLEELSWLLQTHSNLDYRALAENVEVVSQVQRNFFSHIPENKNIHFLVGALPGIFSDERYFPVNEDIAEFARDALELNIVRWEKRSRYELIGLIVCETGRLSDHRLTRLVDALSRITSEDPGAQAIVRARKDHNLSWNDIIQQLTDGSGA